MPFIDLGRKEKNYAVDTVMAGESKKKTVIHHPSFNVNDIELPVSSKDVGKIITVPVKLRINRAGSEIDEYRDNKKRPRAEFSVMGINFPGKKKVDISSLSDAELDAEERKEHKRIMG